MNGQLMFSEVSLADFHCHTTSSDGSLAPEKLLERAIEKNVSHLAITDHDTLHGYRQVCSVTGVHLIPGVEWSSIWNKCSIHVVGLGVNPENEVIIHAENHMHEVRMERAKTIAEKLEKGGFNCPFDAVLELSHGHAPGRPHFVKYLLGTDQGKSEAHLYKKWLGAGKPGDVKSNWPTIEQTIEWTKKGQGIAVLAHPHKYKMTRSKLIRLLDDFVEAGGLGIEIGVQGMHPDLRQMLSNYCIEHDLYASVGSDFHHPANSWCELGKYQPLLKEVTPIWQWLASNPVNV